MNDLLKDADLYHVLTSVQLCLKLQAEKGSTEMRGLVHLLVVHYISKVAKLLKNLDLEIAMKKNIDSLSSKGLTVINLWNCLDTYPPPLWYHKDFGRVYLMMHVVF